MSSKSKLSFILVAVALTVLVLSSLACSNCSGNDCTPTNNGSDWQPVYGKQVDAVVTSVPGDVNKTFEQAKEDAKKAVGQTAETETTEYCKTHVSDASCP